MFRSTSYLKLHGKDIAKQKKRKEEVKQTPEKSNKELEIMEGISKSLQSTASSNDLFGMMIAAKIKNVSPKKKRKIKFEINNLLFKYQDAARHAYSKSLC